MAEAKKKALFVGNPRSLSMIYAAPERSTISRMLDIYAPDQSAYDLRESPGILNECEVIMGGWGMPLMDRQLLEEAPVLKAVFYGAGTVRSFVTDEIWRRNIIVTSAYAANAVPVSEFCVSQIVYSLKKGWQHVAALKETRNWEKLSDVPGAFGRTVGLVSFGMIARKLSLLLQNFDLDVVAYDPFVSEEDMAACGVTKTDLDKVFREADVVSVHTPAMPETEKLLNRSHFEKMKQGATLINTARGSVIDEEALIAVLGERPDLTAVLDVTSPEPPAEDSPLFALPNVILTPHIAGSMAGECRRMGQYTINECKRYLAGKPLEWQITRESAKLMA